MSISPISGESQYITNLQIRSIANSPIEVRSCEMQWLQVFRNLGHLGVWSRINAWGKSTVTFWGFKHLQTVFKAVDFEASLADQHQKKAYSAPQGITFLYSNSQDGMIHKDLWSLQHFKAFPWRKGWKMKEQGEPTAPPDSCFGQPATNRKRWCGWFALRPSGNGGPLRYSDADSPSTCLPSATGSPTYSSCNASCMMVRPIEAQNMEQQISSIQLP